MAGSNVKWQGGQKNNLLEYYSEQLSLVRLFASIPPIYFCVYVSGAGIYSLVGKTRYFELDPFRNWGPIKGFDSRGNTIMMLEVGYQLGSIVLN